MSSELITSWDALSTLERDWDALWRAGAGSRRNCFFFKWATSLVRLSDRSRPVERQPWCVVLRDEGRVVGIAPFLVDAPVPWAGRVVRTFPPIVERNPSLLREGPIRGLARAVRRHARADRVDRLLLKGLLRNEAQALLGAWRSPWNCSVLKLNDSRGSGRPGTTWADVCAIRVPESWDEYLRSRSRHFRGNIRRAYRSVSAAGRMHFWRASGGRQLGGEPLSVDEMVARICQVEQRSWQRQRGTHFSRNGPDYVRFVLSLLLERRMLDLSILHIDGVPVAYAQGFVSGRFSGIRNTAYDPKYRGHSPGILTFAELVRTSIQRTDIREINLRGSSHLYKRELADHAESAFAVELHGDTPRGVLGCLGRRIFARHHHVGRRAAGFVSQLDEPALLGRSARPGHEFPAPEGAVPVVLPTHH